MTIIRLITYSYKQNKVSIKSCEDGKTHSIEEESKRFGRKYFTSHYIRLRPNK